jgi:hypothetical protein
MTELEKFEAWFKQRQRETWNRRRVKGDRDEPPFGWATGYRGLWWEAWQARAALDVTAGEAKVTL